MRDAFRYLTSILFAAVVVQVALAGYGVFNALDKSDDSGSATHKTIEDGFGAHAIVGTAIIAVAVLLLIAAAAGRLGSPWLPMSTVLLFLTALQLVFAELGRQVAALGFLHAVNALAIYALVALLAHRAWTQLRASPA